jgi:hypothetical protein
MIGQALAQARDLVTKHAIKQFAGWASARASWPRRTIRPKVHGKRQVLQYQALAQTVVYGRKHSDRAESGDFPFKTLWWARSQL